MPDIKILTVNKNTWFKIDYTQQADKLPVNQKYQALENQRYSYTSIEPTDYNGHRKVTFQPEVAGIKTWFVFSKDINT